ncbi:MAG TPA: efflux RND transporter permease subunit, partial [Ilumatobacteraceae bacterium]|nr:efflux RND transporter permease subunit [Ilumatobacteraceae bacterium]
PRIVKADSNADAVIRLAVTSDAMSVEDMTILVEDQVLDTLAAVDGVADVQTYGDRNKVFRIDIDQAKVASHGLTLGDLANALATVAFDAPAGSLISGDQNIVVRATANVTTPDQFESIVIN